MPRTECASARSGIGLSARKLSSAANGVDLCVVQGPDPIGDGWPAGIRRGGRSAIGDGGRREDQPAETSGSGPSGPPEVAGASAATPGGCSLVSLLIAPA